MLDLEAIKKRQKDFACFCCNPSNYEELQGIHHPDCTTWQLCDDIRELVAEVEVLRRQLDKALKALAQNEVAEDRRKTREENLTSLGFEEVTQEQRKVNLANNVSPHMLSKPTTNYFWVAYSVGRNEWIDSQGVGHYDASNSFTEHGCNGACWQDDFPGHNKTREDAVKKAKQMGFLPQESL